MATGRRTEAAVAFEQALSLKPDYSEARTGLETAGRP